MSGETDKMAPPNAEVLMLAAETVRQIEQLATLGWRAKRISRELGMRRETVRRYLREGEAAKVQRRPRAWSLDEERRALAVQLLDGPAAGNAVVVRRLLAERGVEVPLRTLQRTLSGHRRAREAAALA